MLSQIIKGQLPFCCHLFCIQFHQTKAKVFPQKKLSVVLMSRKVFLRIQQTAGKLLSCVPSVCCQRDEFIIPQCILL